jgi:hypothetical protein
VEWLVDGQRGVKAMVWTAAGLGLVQYGMTMILFRVIGVSSSRMTIWPLGLVFTAVQGCLFAWAASRFFVEGRRTGELELLLTTPVGARTILTAQWNRLRQIAQWPAALMVAPMLIQAVFNIFMYRGYPRNAMTPYFVINSLLSALEMVFGLGALCWLGMWFGLKARGQAGAIVWTAGMVKGVPYLIWMASQMLFRVLVMPFVFTGGGVGWLVLMVPDVLILWYYVKLIGWAKRRFAREWAPEG